MRYMVNEAPLVLSQIYQAQKVEGDFWLKVQPVVQDGASCVHMYAHLHCIVTSDSICDYRPIICATLGV